MVGYGLGLGTVAHAVHSWGDRSIGMCNHLWRTKKCSSPDGGTDKGHARTERAG